MGAIPIPGIGLIDHQPHFFLLMAIYGNPSFQEFNSILRYRNDNCRFSLHGVRYLYEFYNNDNNSDLLGNRDLVPDMWGTRDIEFESDNIDIPLKIWLPNSLLNWVEVLEEEFISNMEILRNKHGMKYLIHYLSYSMATKLINGNYIHQPTKPCDL